MVEIESRWRSAGRQYAQLGDRVNQVCGIQERLVRTAAANRKYPKGYDTSFSSCRKVPRQSTAMESFPAVDLQIRVGVPC
jgi:hypothetical protein